MSRAWFACDEPERPPDPYVRWHICGCRGCLFKVEVQERYYPEDPHVRILADLLRSYRDEPELSR